jgi:integrase
LFKPMFMLKSMCNRSDLRPDNAALPALDLYIIVQMFKIMGTYKRGKTYWYKFQWQGKSIRKSTKQRNDKVARDMESAHRTSLAKGEVGIREKKPAPLLKDFLKNDFLPFAQTRHKYKPMTLRYYRQGCDLLTKSNLGGLRLDEFSDQQAQEFARKHAVLSPSGINRGLRTLRRSLNLAFEWAKLERPVKITLAPGEHQRDRVLTDTEITKYLDACPQPWKDCATLIVDEGFRPSEVFALEWQHILLHDDDSGFIQIAEGKSKAAKRTLPMTPRVHGVLSARWESAGKPVAGFLFPSAGKSGHVSQDGTKDQHKKALENSGVVAFVPYVLRHTALTNLGERAGGDVFVLARIAGHSTIAVTQRYIHPQADAIGRVFAAALPKVGTKLGTARKPRKTRAPRASQQMLLKSA